MTSFRQLMALLLGLALARPGPIGQAADPHPGRLSARRLDRHGGAHAGRKAARAARSQPVIVENKPGAGGRLAAEALKHSAPDRPDLHGRAQRDGVVPDPAVSRVGAAYDMLNDFAPVACMVSYPLALAVGTETGVKPRRNTSPGSRPTRKKACFGIAGAGRTYPLQWPAARQGRGRRLRSCPTGATARWPPTCSADRFRPAS